MEIVTNPWVELALENQLARGLQGTGAHSSDTDLMVALSLLVAPLTY